MACIATDGIGTLAFTGDFIAGRRKRATARVYKCILCAQIQHNASRPTAWCINIQQENNPKHEADARGDTSLTSQIKYLNSIPFHRKDQIKGRDTPQQAIAKGGCCEGLEECPQRRYKVSGDLTVKQQKTESILLPTFTPVSSNRLDFFSLLALWKKTGV